MSHILLLRIAFNSSLHISPPCGPNYTLDRRGSKIDPAELQIMIHILSNHPILLSGAFSQETIELPKDSAIHSCRNLQK